VVSWKRHSEGVRPAPLEAKGSNHSLPVCYDFVDVQSAVKGGRPIFLVERDRKNTKLSLKLYHRKQLGLKCCVSGAPVFLRTIAILPFLSV